MSGAFVAVVGPSGSGKDSILEGARAELEGQDAIVFPRRLITRPASVGEDHVPTTVGEFAAAESRGDFALTWRAHGLSYGISADVLGAVESGGVVVANVSRAVLEQLPGLFPNVQVVRVTVSDEVRLARIVARGRENAAAAKARVARADPAPLFPVDLEIVNDGALADASAELVAFLAELTGALCQSAGAHDLFSLQPPSMSPAGPQLFTR